jgi:hypothetical protein
MMTSLQKEKLNSLVSLAREEASLVPSLTQLARIESTARRLDISGKHG